MKWLEFIQDWMALHPTATSIFEYLLWVVFILFAIRFLRKLLKRNISDIDYRYKSQKGIEVIGYLILIILSLSYFTGNIKDFTIAIGLLTTGLAFTLQELILSIAGSFYIFAVKVYKPGDRIEINGVKGDVIDIDSIYTTMMEIGKWVSSDNYSGRIIKLSNAFVFKGPIFNYSQDFPFIWDEFNLPIRYGSDIELAKEIALKVARKILLDYTTQSTAQWKTVVKKYYIEDAQVEPTLAITLTDNWIQFNIRYIVDYRRRRSTMHLLQEEFERAVKETDGKVVISSSTFELVKLPEIKIDMNSSQSPTTPGDAVS